MDKITSQAVYQMMADLAENGGGTYEHGTFLPFRPISGYAVAVGGVAIAAENVTPDVLAFIARGVSGEYMTPYVGTWLNEGVVYIDGVRYFGPDRREAAILLGQEAGQLAIYNFANGRSIDL